MQENNSWFPGFLMRIEFMHLRREILIRDFNKRERIILELICQMTIDMKRETANFVPAESAAIGIHRNHLYPVFDNLLKAKVLLKKDDGFQINSQIADWEIKVPEGREQEINRLFYNHQNGGNLNNRISSSPCNRKGGDLVKEKESTKEKEKKGEKNIYIKNTPETPEPNSVRCDESINQLFDYFKTQFAQTMGFPYRVNEQKDPQRITALLDQFGEEHSRELIEEYFRLRKSGHPYLSTTGMNLGMLLRFVNHLHNSLLKEKQAYGTNQHQQRENHSSETTAYLESLRQARIMQSQRTRAVQPNDETQLGRTA
jgi:hypothetical protein